MARMVVGFSRPKKFSIGSTAIRIAENSPFSHAYIRWHANGIERDMIYQASHGMVHFVSGESFDKDAETVVSYYIDLADEQFKNVVRKCVDLAGTKYGTLALAGMGFERATGIKSPFRDGNKTFVCSELVGEVLKQCGIADVAIDLELAGPKRLEAAISSISSFSVLVDLRPKQQR